MYHGIGFCITEGEPVITFFWRKRALAWRPRKMHLIRIEEDELDIYLSFGDPIMFIGITYV